MHDHLALGVWMLSGTDGRRAVEDRLAVHRAELRLMEPVRPSRIRGMMERARAAVLPFRATEPVCCPA
jgi:hypothetical protein